MNWKKHISKLVPSPIEPVNNDNETTTNTTTTTTTSTKDDMSTNSTTFDKPVSDGQELMDTEELVSLT